MTNVGGNGTLALRGDQTDWLPVQRAALSQLGIDEAPEADQRVFLHVAQRSGLDPFARQIYLIGRWDSELGRKRFTIQTGIEGYRVIAERRPEYGGLTEPQWCGEDGVWRDVWTAKEPPVAARVGVIRKGWDQPVWGVAHFWEFAATKKDGGLNHMWLTKGRHQIAKCSEALALRRAFPQDFAGIYTHEEMEQGDHPAPAPRVVIESEREQPAEPDWDALIAQHESTGELAALGETWKLARGMRPNDGALLDRIAAAAERVKAAAAMATPAQGEESPGPTGDTPAEKSQTNRLFALLRDGAVSGKDRDVRLRIVSRILNRIPAVSSFDDLTAADVDVVNAFLQRLKDEGHLTHTLADLAADPPGTAPGAGSTGDAGEAGQ